MSPFLEFVASWRIWFHVQSSAPSHTCLCSKKIVWNFRLRWNSFEQASLQYIITVDVHTAQHNCPQCLRNFWCRYIRCLVKWTVSQSVSEMISSMNTSPLEDWQLPCNKKRDFLLSPSLICMTLFDNNPARNHSCSELGFYILTTWPS